jgi:CHASE3 domain sensor protein
MIKYFVSFLLMAGLLVSVCGEAVAQTESEEFPISISIAQVSESVEVADEDAGILPTSPWYFLKEWRRGFVKFFKFSAEAKAEYELEIADEKALELRAVEQKDPNDEEAIVAALNNYVEAKELLEARFTSLTRVLNDKNREKAEMILDKWEQKFDEHRALFDELAEKHGDIPEVKDVSGKLDWATPLIKFRGNLDDLAETLRRIQDTDEFRDQVKEIEDIKEDIEEGSKARSARADCAAIEADLAALKQKLVTGGIAGPEFARQFGILSNELKACKDE